MTYSRGITTLANQIGLSPDLVAHAYRITQAGYTAHRRSNFPNLSDDQYTRMIFRDRYPVVCVASIAMRLAERRDDARRLFDIFHASENKRPPRTPIRPGVGTLPEHAHNQPVQEAIRILAAADLPPIHTDGTHVASAGFVVLPACDDLPGWLYILPDPHCETRNGFTGGRHGYGAALNWAGWGVIAELDDTPFIAVCRADTSQETA